jgi:CelD/BcsL family acetyltransferase involved in cellulose biosynthesis
LAELSAAPVERSAALEADWERLAQSPFSTPAWSAAASTHLAGVGERLYACRRPSGELAAVVALTAESDGQVQLARWVGDRAGDEYGPA